MQLTFIQTGGTIDKDYPRSQGGYAFEFGEPATERILERLQPSFAYEIHTPFQKDSQEIDDADRDRIAELVGARIGGRIVITHGTDTMIETARYLARTIAPDTVVVLTGAMRPERFSNSDAAANLGAAIAGAQTLGGGVYVAMHGLLLPADRASRDPSTGQFRPDPSP